MVWRGLGPDHDRMRSPRRPDFVILEISPRDHRRSHARNGRANAALSSRIRWPCRHRPLAHAGYSQRDHRVFDLVQFARRHMQRPLRDAGLRAKGPPCAKRSQAPQAYCGAGLAPGDAKHRPVQVGSGLTLSRERSGRCGDSGSRMDRLEQSASRFEPLSLIQINDKSRRANRAVVVTTNVAIPPADVRLQ